MATTVQMAGLVHESGTTTTPSPSILLYFRYNMLIPCMHIG